MKKIAIILCLFTSISLFSQTDFRIGYIINNQGEKVNGFINYKENSSIYEYCEFKTTPEGQIKEYYPNSIRGYGFENDKFFASKNISTQPDKNENKFLEVIISGIATLYKYTRTYYLEKDGVFKLLDNEIVEYTQDSKTYRRQSKKYIGTLKVLLNDCSKVKKRIDATGYDEKSLEKLVNQYSECKGQKSVIYKEDKPWFKTSFGSFIGYNYSVKKLSKLNSYHKFNKDVKPSSSITFGVYVNLMSPRMTEKLSFYTGVFYESLDFHDYQKTNNSANSVSISELFSSINQIKLPIGIKYSFPEKKLTPYLIIGVSNSFLTNSNTKWIIENEENNTIQIENYSYSSSVYNLGAWASFGVKKKLSEKLFGFIEIKYEISKHNYLIEANNGLDLTNFTNGFFDHNDTINNLQVLIGIEL